MEKPMVLITAGISTTAWDEAARKNREAIEYHAANPQALDETEDTTHLFDV